MKTAFQKRTQDVKNQKQVEAASNRLERFFEEKIIPTSGNAETVQGEMLRAIAKMAYRWNNDGDKFYIGYGIETTGPAYSFLTSMCFSNEVAELAGDLNKLFIGSQLCNGIDDYEGDSYSLAIGNAINWIVDFYEKSEKEGTLIHKKVDFYNWESVYEFEDYNKDNWFDDED